MKIHKNNLNILSAFLSGVIVLTAGVGCSYLSDAVEGAITNRAAFSIDASYNRSAQQVTLTWDETGGSNFAGYEIYITDEQDNEYAGYTLVESKWSNGLGTSSHLEDVSRGYYTHDVNSIVSSSFPNGPGTYFYRIGIIEWDDDLDERTDDNGYSHPYDPNNPSSTAWDNEYNYNNQTNIDKISGYVQVDIY